MASPIVNQIRRLRFEHGEMTQSDLAMRIGMTRQTVAAIEAGKYAPSLEAAFRIAKVLGAGVEDVFQWVQAPGPVTPAPPERSSPRLNSQ